MLKKDSFAQHGDTFNHSTGEQRQTDLLFVQEQPDLFSKFQNSQGYCDPASSQKLNKTERNNKTEV